MKSMDTTSMRHQQSLEVLRLIDEACTRFERALRRGEMLNIAEIVAGANPELRQQLLRDLLMLEMEYRSKNGESPSLEQFRARFPDDGPLVKYLYLERFVPPHLADFSIQQLLGRGAYGHVYQGWDAKLTRHVALKVFRRDPSAPSLHGGSLRAEARIVAQLRHPGIVAVYAVQQDDDGDEFLVLEYVDGKSLEDLLRGERPSPNEATRILLEVVQALQHAHQHGLVHRDLKPANILLDAAHRPRVTDFGLALHLTTTGGRPEIAGTLAYMAPEQAGGETHRLDARTDLWAVGVIFYRLLSGRLPFSGTTNQELLEAIRYSEPQDLRGIDPQISPELARIVRRSLAKRMSERYQSAAELADDLGAFLNAKPDRAPAQVATGESLIAVVPKGLRCFDANDRDFFLSLVPGPRDRHGVPSAVLVWERHLQKLDPHETFRVGLLYGPSGCGKSSLIRAGILPRLPSNVKVLVVESVRDETEMVLIRELRRRFPGITSDLTLPELLRDLREGVWLEPGEKLLIVFDQFEQWLHGWRQDEATQLIEALRQCDGGRVQSLILVRDDFWMPATRFFQQLDVPLVEGFNASAVDLFDRTHATKVLAAFGVAYRQLDDKTWRQGDDPKRFLERAVDELAEGGWIVPVRLCIFAEMVKSRPWSTATLQDVGGAQGLGAAFLEEVFDGRSASPMYRLHRQAARQVLERLLPPAGTDIRGHLVTESELQVASGYEQRPSDFAGLLRCLDQQLRLITPSDIDASRAGNPDPHASAAPRLYQLTHDFLVQAIRGWLNQSRRRTMRGRAELRLADYAEAYAARQEAQQLPSLREWFGLLVLTRPRAWPPNARAMMRRAGRYHALRYGIVIGLALVAGLFVYNRMTGIHAEGLVHALATSDSRDVPRLAQALTPYQTSARPFLEERLGSGDLSSDQRTRALLGLVAVGEPQTEALFDDLLEAEPSLAVAIVEVLAQYGQLETLNERLWKVASNPEATPAHRLRASVALARLSGPEVEWRAIGPQVAAFLLRATADNPDHFGSWVDGLLGAKGYLSEPLRQSFADPQGAPEERLLAAKILARYSAGKVETLSDLALQSTPKQFEVFVPLLTPHGSAIRTDLLREVRVMIPADASEEEKDRLARRQANAILLLHRTAQDEYLWSGLAHRPDPRLRSFLLDSLRQSSDVPAAWIDRLSQENDPGVRQALTLVLGGTLALSGSEKLRADLTDTLLGIYRDDRDPGVHSAAEWTLGRLGAQASIDTTREKLSKLGMRPGYRWYVTKSGLTMVIFEPTGPVRLGSPETEPGHESDEGIWNFDPDWSFALATTEITQQQYLDVCGEHKEHLNEFASDPKCPVNAVNWFDAIRFCRLLSEREAVPDEEMVVPPWQISPIGRLPPGGTRIADFRHRIGYRLPTEAEWEVACRAGTTTARFFGYTPDLLPSYCCYIANSGGEAWSVGTAWPNQAGFFDILGNISEWCFDVFEVDPRSPVEPTRQPGSFLRYATRGNTYGSSARMVRTANRRSSRYDDAGYGNGIRVAHTIRNR